MSRKSRKPIVTAELFDLIPTDDLLVQYIQPHGDGKGDFYCIALDKLNTVLRLQRDYTLRQVARWLEYQAEEAQVKNHEISDRLD